MVTKKAKVYEITFQTCRVQGKRDQKFVCIDHSGKIFKARRTSARPVKAGNSDLPNLIFTEYMASSNIPFLVIVFQEDEPCFEKRANFKIFRPKEVGMIVSASIATLE